MITRQIVCSYTISISVLQLQNLFSNTFDRKDTVILNLCAHTFVAILQHYYHDKIFYAIYIYTDVISVLVVVLVLSIVISGVLLIVVCRRKQRIVWVFWKVHTTQQSSQVLTYIYIYYVDLSLANIIWITLFTVWLLSNLDTLNVSNVAFINQVWILS